MQKKVNVFILAAGRGERLRPITNHIPKPLVPILGKAVLQHVLERVSTLPLHRIALNLHYKKEEIGGWIVHSRFGERTMIFDEETILGTGGALKNAESFLQNHTFLVHNADVHTDMDFEKLLVFHQDSKNLATLAVHDCRPFNSVLVDEEGMFQGIKGHAQKLEDRRAKAFTGIAVYEPEFLKFLHQGPYSVVDAWREALSRGQRLGTLDVSGCSWSDIGTVSSYASTVFHVLRQSGETLFIHPAVQNCGDFRMSGFVVMEEGSRAEKGASLANCLVLPGGHAEVGAHYGHCIIGPGFVVDIDESDILGSTSGKDRILIGTGGSERRYFRKRGEEKGIVVMQCTDEDPDFIRHIEYTRFFLNHEIPVPLLRGVEPEEKRAIFEDLGDHSLYSWLQCRRKEEVIEGIYRKVLDILLQIHSLPLDRIHECPLLLERIFDYDHFRWETEYFLIRFVEAMKGTRVESRLELDGEFHRLALRADSFAKTIIHRDFQSQNIMITRGDIPRPIDFQGARVGPPGYDVVSILWDPYHRLERDLRDRLLDYYIQNFVRTTGEKFDEEDFRKTLLTCRLQRHMQALGAYGFLSGIKGKRYFLKHIPEGLRLLKEESAQAQKEYPELHRLVESL